MRDDSKLHCSMCGHLIRVVQADEGTAYYEPVEEAPEGYVRMEDVEKSLDETSRTLHQINGETRSASGYDESIFRRIKKDLRHAGGHR